ncbi:MAG: alpha/beta fold hydrolase [Lentisphaeria bacterium]|nr:alpha/beta fold hydrolase [Lentisphaeria bacterium]
MANGVFEYSPEWEMEEWYGFKRYKFQFEGRLAWVAEPETPAGDGRWSWCTQWAEAFVPRVGTVALLQNGFHHAHIDIFDTKASPEGVAVMGRFHDFLVSRGLSAKANMIGMSWGGFISLRYSSTYPERIAAIYLDAPVCNAADPGAEAADRVEAISEQYGLSVEELKTSLLNPLNNLKFLADYKIPLYIATGEDDTLVKVSSNINLVEEELKRMGVAYEIVRRQVWGHHPHGFDDVSEVLKFHQNSRA